jgi:hypothetical protein
LKDISDGTKKEHQEVVSVMWTGQSKGDISVDIIVQMKMDVSTYEHWSNSRLILVILSLGSIL